MSNAKGTPGPWTASHGGYNRWVVTARGAGPVGGNVIVSEIYGTVGCAADAALIAAAPTLADTLEDLVAYVDLGDPQDVADFLKAIQTDARAALRAAGRIP